MAQKKPIKKSAGKKKSQPKLIEVDIKVNLLHTVADAIYSTSTGKIREAVANSRDKGATWVIVSADPSKNRLSIFDNGHGISRQRFKEIFDNIGYGLQQDDQTKLSYFGIGLMSIFQLGNKVKLYTCPKEDNEVLLLEVDTKGIFDPKNKDKSISSLSKYFSPLSASSNSSRQRSSIPYLNDIFTKRKPVALPSHFTEIIIDGIKDSIFEEICSQSFFDDLSKVLPLRIEDKEPFLKRFSSKKATAIKSIIHNSDYCKTINFYFARQDEGNVQQIWKYFPKFSSGIRFPDDNILHGISKEGGFAYYVVHTLAENLERKKAKSDDYEKEIGFWIRNQNFLVKSADFLDKPGPGRRPKGTIDKPLRNWVFGEIFHKDMNQFLTVSRNDFLFERPEFHSFRSSFLSIVNPLNESIRAIWERRKKIVGDLVNPFAEIIEPEGSISRAQKKLRELIGQDLKEIEFYKIAKKELSNCRDRKLENDKYRIDVIMKKKRTPIILSDDNDAIVKIDPKLSGKVETSETRWDASKEKLVVDISPDLFEPKQVLFLGETFSIYYVAKKESENAISFNFDDNQIYINPFNRDLSLYSVNILEVYIALEVADTLSNTQDELKRNFIRMLGPAPTEVIKYIAPLGDDLRRSVAHRR